MKQNILIAGGSGFLGNHLTNYLKLKGYNVSILSRKKITIPDVETYQWNPYSGLFDERCLIGQDVIINLSGTGIANSLWTKKRKEDIIKSRKIPIDFLYQKILESNNKPQLFISSSATGYYGNRPGEELSEQSSKGSDFLAHVCELWEHAAQNFKNLNIPTYIIRKGVVLSQDSPFVIKIRNSQKSKLNVIPGNGKQFVAWIALEDYLAGIEFIIREKPVPRIYNFTSPVFYNIEHIQNSIKNFFNNRLITIHLPAKVLKFLTGGFSDIFLNTQKVFPEKLLSIKFQFTTKTIEEGLS